VIAVCFMLREDFVLYVTFMPGFLTSYSLTWSTTSGSVSTLHLIVGLGFSLNQKLGWPGFNAGRF